MWIFLIMKHIPIQICEIICMKFFFGHCINKTNRFYMLLIMISNQNKVLNVEDIMYPSLT